MKKKKKHPFKHIFLNEIKKAFRARENKIFKSKLPNLNY